MNELLRHTGIFRIWDNPGWSTELLREWISRGFAPHEIPGLGEPVVVKNLLMASQKLLMATAVYPTIDRLIITSQTGLPVDSETSYSGTLYETSPGEEITRSGNVNPYTVGWSIQDDAANGSWGSFVLVTSTGAMINRALAGVTKTSGTAKLVMFTGEVTQ